MFTMPVYWHSGRSMLSCDFDLGSFSYSSNLITPDLSMKGRGLESVNMELFYRMRFVRVISFLLLREMNNSINRDW